MIRARSFILYALLVIIPAVCAMLPLFSVIHTLGSDWRGVIPTYVTDSHFYTVQIKKAIDGPAFGNNPFFLEHKDDRAPVFSVAQWIAGLPMRAGMSFTAGLLFGLAVSSAALVLLLYALFRSTNIPKRWSFFLAFVAYAPVYGMMVRPVIMELVLPVLALFWVALWLWLRNPAARKNQIMLILASAASFYIYSYLWQIVVVTLGLVFIFRPKILMRLLPFILLFALPSLWYTWQAMHQQLYWELIKRVGYLSTHIPSSEAYYYGRWFLMLMVFWIFVYWLAKKLPINPMQRKVFFFFAVTGAGIFGILMSNIITGRDFDIGNHVNRFLIFWFGVCLAIGIYYVCNVLRFRQIGLLKKGVLGLFLVLNLALYIRQLPRSIAAPFETDLAVARQIQSERDPIDWIEKNSPQTSVIWANSLSNQVLTMSRHYVLFPGMLNFMVYLTPSQEIQERYLMAIYFENRTASRLEQSYPFYAGVNAEYELKHAAWKTRLCHIMRLGVFAGDCDQYKNAVAAWVQTEHRSAVDRMLQLDARIRPRMYEYLKKYHVGYIIKDLKRDSNMHPETIENIELVYRTNEFEIYKVN